VENIRLEELLNNDFGLCKVLVGEQRHLV
jgi:hypothetical protein